MNKRVYEESIILIGPSGVGKSTIAEELSKKTNMPKICLDKLAKRARDTGVRKRFESSDEFNYYMISEIIKEVVSKDVTGIADFGAGHSVYDNEEIFTKLKKLLQPFKNIVLLIPDKDIEKSLAIMARRSTGDVTHNREFIESHCNIELATMTIYENDRKPSEIADEIIDNIRKRRKKEIEV